MRKYALFFLSILLFTVGGCLNTGDSASDPISSGYNFYFDEFPDVPIPNEMKAQKKDTFITYSADGVKLGTQIVVGRVEMASLVNAMHSHMQREGWTLRSVFRSSRSILIFEKAEKLCSMYIGDGAFETTMLIFVSPKLQEGALQYSVPQSTSTEPLAPTDPVMGDPNITVYPAR